MAGSDGGHTLTELLVAGQVLLYDQGLFHGTIPLHYTTVLIKEELGEVPFDGISQDAPSLGLGFHLLPQRVGIISVHTEIATHIKCDIIAGSELFDLCISPWLLAPGSWLPKLVARGSQDPYTALSISGVQVDAL